MAKKKVCTDIPSTSRRNRQQTKYSTRATKDKIGKKPLEKTKNTGGARNRASPARLVKIYPSMSKDQKKKIKDAGFGGLLDIKCDKMPADLIQWLLTERFDAKKCELLLPGRGIIRVTSEAAVDMTGLPNPSNGAAVKYDLDVVAIDFIHKKYQVEDGVAPRITPFIKELEVNKECDDDYLRSWLIVAICTFVCPTTCLGISPRCYPSVVDVSAVKNLKWADFLVDQLRISGNKMDKRNSVKGCVFFLMLLYLDSLDHGLEISDCEPRLGAWDNKLVEKVVEMDRKDDGSFGRLKLKQTKHTVIDTAIGGFFPDIERFVSAKVARGLPSQDKMKLTEAFGHAFNGFSQVMGDLLQSVSEVLASSGATQKSAERRGLRTEDSEDEEEFSDRVSEEEDDLVGSDMSMYEHDEDSYQEEEDSYQEADSDEYIEQELQDSEDDPHVGKQDGGCVQQPQQAEVIGQQELQPEDAAAAVQDEVQPANNSVHVANPAEGVEQHPTPPAPQQDDVNICPNILVSTPAPAPVPQRDLSTARRKIISRKRRWGRLRLPANKEIINLATPECLPGKSDTPLPQENVVHNLASTDDEGIEAMRPPKHKCFSADQSTSKKSFSANTWNFEAPQSFDILGFAEQQTSKGQPQDSNRERPDWLDDSFLDNMSWDEFQKLEDDAYMMLRKTKSNETTQGVCQDGANEVTPAAKATGKSIPNISSSKSNQVTTPADLKFHQSTSIPSVISSGTPAYQPPPRRIIKPSFAMQSPFYQERTNQFKCSKEVLDVYNAVCRFSSARTTRSSQSPKQNQIIINFLYFWVSLKELPDSVRQGNELESPVAEVAICAMNEFDPDKKSRKKIPKRVLPLRVATFIQKNQLDAPEVRRVFRRSENHLDRNDMVMFPVLQKWKNAELDSEVGHYFLLVLNLRELQFEVLDSMRTLQDKNLRDCCALLMDGIKTLWKMHYPNSKKDIEAYHIEYIESPQQINNIDCGFHMLMNAEEWKGRHEPSYKGSDIPNIRKIMTHQWITHEKNDVGDWRSRLGMEKK